MYKKISLFVTGIICACSLVACTSQETGSEGKVDSPSGMVVAVSANQEGYYSGVITKFKKAHPDQEIELVTLPSFENVTADEAQKNLKILDDMQVQLMAGKGPDVFILDEDERLFSDLYKMCYSGAFLDLHTVMEGMEELPISPVIREAGVLDGKQYFLPLGYNVSGIAVPDELLALCETETADPLQFLELVKQQANVSALPLESELKFSASSVYGDPFLDYEEKMFVLDEKRKAWVQYAAEVPSGTAVQESFPDIVNLGEKIGYDRLSRAFAEKNDVTFLPFPNGKSGVNAQISVYAAVRANSAYAKEAGNLCAFMLSDDMQKVTDWNNGKEPFKAIPVNQNVLKEVFTKRLSVGVTDDQKDVVDAKVDGLVEMLSKLQTARYTSTEDTLLYVAIDKSKMDGKLDQIFETLEHEFKFYFDE